MKLPTIFRKNFWNSTRGRLFSLVLLVIIPALIVQLVGSWIDLRQNLASQKQDVSHIDIHAQADSLLRHFVPVNDVYKVLSHLFDDGFIGDHDSFS